MSIEREGWKLSVEEIAAIQALSGQTQFVCLTQARQLQPQQLLNACCSLVKDRLMTQTNGKYRLSRELAQVMEPVCRARMILSLMPGKGRRGQRLYYVGQSVTMMEQSAQGVVLTQLETVELADVLWECMELHPVQEQHGPAPWCPEAFADREQLLRGAAYLVEKLDPFTGSRLGWLRILRQALNHEWVQWMPGRLVRQEPLDGRSFAAAIAMMLEGETV